MGSSHHSTRTAAALLGLSSHCPQASAVVASGLSSFAASGILVPWPGIEPKSPALQGGVLNTGPSWIYFYTGQRFRKIHDNNFGICSCNRIISALYDSYQESIFKEIINWACWIPWNSAIPKSNPFTPPCTANWNDSTSCLDGALGSFKTSRNLNCWCNRYKSLSIYQMLWRYRYRYRWKYILNSQDIWHLRL